MNSCVSLSSFILLIVLVCSLWRVQQGTIIQSTILKHLESNEFSKISQTVFSNLEEIKKENVIRNPVTKETWYVINTEHETGGELWEMYEQMDAGAFVVAEHIHPYQLESVFVINGTCDILVHGKVLVAHPGDYIVIPAGISHVLQNSRNESTLLKVEYRPSLTDMKLFFKAFAGLGQDGYLFSNAIPHPLHTVLLWQRFPGLAAFKWLPEWLQDIVTFLLVPVSNTFGYSIDKYIVNVSSTL